MTQREYGFAGGIQAGTTASSAESLGLERAVRDAVAVVGSTAYGMTWSRGMTGARLASLLGVEYSQIAGCAPDGGQWTLSHEPDGAPLLAIECKKQGAVGNAIERWYKNYSIYHTLGVRVYLTLCVGDGFFDGHSAQRTLETAVALEPGDRHRLDAGLVWNTPMGRIRLYRTVAEAVEHVVDVLLDLLIELEPDTVPSAEQ